MPKPCWITPQETGTAVICPSGSLLTGVSSCFSDFPKNISVFTHPKSILELFPSRPTEGRFAIVTNVGHGMRWTRQRFARDGIAGRVGERPVSDQKRADEGCCSVRRSRVVLTPRRWRQVLRRLVRLNRAGQNLQSAGRRWQKSPIPGRARRKPLKPLRAGMPGDSGVLVVTRVRSTTTKCTRGRGCQGHPAFPTPSLGGRFINGSGAWRGEVANVCLELGRRHCEERSDEAIHSSFTRRDGLLRFARNDVIMRSPRAPAVIVCESGRPSIPRC